MLCLDRDHNNGDTKADLANEYPVPRSSFKESLRKYRKQESI